MEQEILFKLMQYLEAAEGMGAFAWQAAQKQVGVQALQMSGTVAVLFAVAAVLTYAIRWAMKQQEDDWAAFVAMCGFLTVVAVVAGWFFLLSAVGYLMNPDYYAIKVLLELVPMP